MPYPLFDGTPGRWATAASSLFTESGQAPRGAAPRTTPQSLSSTAPSAKPLPLRRKERLETAVAPFRARRFQLRVATISREAAKSRSRAGEAAKPRTRWGHSRDGPQAATATGQSVQGGGTPSKATRSLIICLDAASIIFRPKGKAGRGGEANPLGVPARHVSVPP